MSWREIVAILIQPPLTVSSIWLSVHLAMNKFVREQRWTRKENAFKSIIKSLISFEKFFGYYHDAILKIGEISKDREVSIKKEFEDAKSELRKTIDSESWALSSEALEIIQIFDADMSKNYDDWFDDIESKYASTAKTIKKLKERARQELSAC